jgi:hypothetical protein
MPTNRLRGAAAALACLVLVSAVATGVADAKPRTTKVKHVGQVEGMAHSRISFTLVKSGRKITKVQNIRLHGVELFCDDADDNFFTQLWSGTFPGMKMGHASGATGFGLSELRFEVEGFSDAYKTIFGLVSHGGRRAHGDLRVRWYDDVKDGGCGGSEERWTSRAVKR